MKRAPYNKDLHWAPWVLRAEQLRAADPFCSSPYWGIPLLEAFHPHGQLYVYQDEQGRGLGLFNERQVRGGRLCLPADGVWLMGCPLLSEDPEAFALGLTEDWQRRRPPTLRQVCVTGLFKGHPLLRSAFWSRCVHWELPKTARHVASLDGGVDGFMSRRSANFRSRLRRTYKKLLAQGLTWEFMPEHLDELAAEQMWSRVVAVEQRCWKGLSGQGIDQGSMQVFYRTMLPLLALDGRLRGLFLQREGEDIAYLFGAFFAGYFRGLQFSYVHEESEGLGNVAQFLMIGRLVEQGCERYDLGQAMDYKKRWAEVEVESYSFAFQLPRAQI